MTSPREYADDDLVPAATAARLIGVSRSTIRKYADAGRVPVRRTPSNHRRFKVGDLRQWMTESETPAAAPPAQRSSAADDECPAAAGRLAS